jgi:hypothetical protein
MLRKGFLILLLFFFSLHARAQLSYAEFFFDSDPGVGNGLVLNFNPADSLNQTFSFSTIGLQPGPHQVFWRFRNAQGVWGLTQHQSFFLQSDLSAAEYFFDHDPGHGNATPLNVSLSVDSIQSVLSFNSAGLSPGPHRVFWRFRNGQGVWGLPNLKPSFFKTVFKLLNIFSTMIPVREMVFHSILLFLLIQCSLSFL